MLSETAFLLNISDDAGPLLGLAQGGGEVAHSGTGALRPADAWGRRRQEETKYRNRQKLWGDLKLPDPEAGWSGLF